MKTKIPAILAIAAMMLPACKKDHKDQPTDIPTIDVAEVQIDSIMLSKVYPGALKANSTVDIVGRVNGYLVSQNYKDGDKVQKGQVLFQIEPTQYRDAVTQAQAALETAKSQYDYASRNYQAMQKALQSDAVSQMEVIQAKSAMETAQASVSNAQAALQTAQTNLGYCTIRAPFTGMVTKSNYDVGAFINGAGAPVTLATIYDNSQLDAEFFIEDQSYLKAFADGRNMHLIDYDSVPVSFSEELPHKYTGRLDYIAPDIDTSTGSMLLRLNIKSPYGELRDGMYATINLPYAVDTHAILVKDAAISTSQNKKYLYVVSDSSTVVYTPIEVGEMANDSMRIVTSGVKGGEKYVTKALLKVRPGMKIKPLLTN